MVLVLTWLSIVSLLLDVIPVVAIIPILLYIGALIGALTLATVNPNHRRGIAIMGVMALFGIMLILFSLSTYGSPLILSFLVIALIGMFQTPFHALSNSVLLDASPEDMRGRVIALLSLDSWR